ncbi:hypothetical protein VTG60DRAFT_226 [Thermothelomyces hinnuleus]
MLSGVLYEKRHCPAPASAVAHIDKFMATTTQEVQAELRRQLDVWHAAPPGPQRGPVPTGAERPRAAPPPPAPVSGCWGSAPHSQPWHAPGATARSTTRGSPAITSLESSSTVPPRRPATGQDLAALARQVRRQHQDGRARPLDRAVGRRRRAGAGVRRPRAR